LLRLWRRRDALAVFSSSTTDSDPPLRGVAPPLEGKGHACGVFCRYSSNPPLQEIAPPLEEKKGAAVFWVAAVESSLPSVSPPSEGKIHRRRSEVP